MADGYNTQILWVDLSEGRTEVRKIDEEVMRKHIGGQVWRPRFSGRKHRQTPSLLALKTR